MGFPVN